jgi:hypothetical protein
MEVVRSYGEGEASHIVIHPRLAEQFEYGIQIIEDSGIVELKRARKLFVRINEDGNALDFKEKKSSDPNLLVIPLRDIMVATSVAVQTKYMMIKKDNLLVQIDLAKSDNSSSASLPGDDQTENISIRFDMNKGQIPTLLDQINQFKDEKINSSVSRANAVAKDPKLCIQCAKKRYALEYRHDYNLCLDCFSNNYGRIIIEAPMAEYHGGHKAYLGGGAFDKFEYGRLILSEHYLIFTRGHKDPTKRWEIVIPLDSVIIERWGIEEESRRKGISGGAFSYEGIGIGSGMIHDSGKSHRIVVPYMDENGIPQEPRFGVSSFRGKAIRELAVKLYQQVASEKKDTTKLSTKAGNNLTQQSDLQSVPITGSDDPLKILKIRYAKGEITKEQYEDMRKMLE